MQLVWGEYRTCKCKGSKEVDEEFGGLGNYKWSV